MNEELEKREEKEITNIESIPDEENDDYTDDSLYDISSWGADFSFREIVQMYNDDDIIKPEIQRNYVWSESEASRFIDSILLGLPVPSIFLAKTRNEKMLIIDGYQRIMTVRDFIKGVFSETNSVFKLTDSEKIHKNWKGKTFNQLSDTEQRKIRQTTIHSIIFVQNKPKDEGTSYFQIFERINSTGRPLIAQEIRNCVYQGSFNRFLIKLNLTNHKWRKLYGIEKPDSRMRDIEFILRYFAIASQEWRYDEVKKEKNSTEKIKVWRSMEDLKGQISLKQFLNEFMGSKDSKSKEVLVERENTFNQVIDFIYQNIGTSAFQNLTYKKNSKLLELTGKFNPPIFDSIMTATQIAIESGKKINKNNLEEKRRKLLQDKDFMEYIFFRTTNKKNIANRIGMALHYLYGMKYE